MTQLSEEHQPKKEPVGNRICHSCMIIISRYLYLMSAVSFQKLSCKPSGLILRFGKSIILPT